MASDSHRSRLDRRTVLGTIGSTVGASSALTQVAGAVKDTNRKFVGKAYDPVTEKEQGDASAVLNRTRTGLKGKLSIAGFTIPFGKQGRLTDENSHPSAASYSFVADGDRFTVEENGREVPLVVRIDMLDDRVTGTIKRPVAEYGSLAFSLNPVDQGFTSDDVGKGLRPERRSETLAAEISLPEEGIPTDNSMGNMPTVESDTTPDTQVGTFDYRPPGYGGGGGSGDDEGDKEVGFLATDSVSGSISEDFPDRCSDETAGSSWEYNLGTSAERRYEGDGTLATDYDEIGSLGGFKRFQMQAHFSEVPDRYIQECDQEYNDLPYQTGVEFWVHQAGSTTQNDASLSKPHPDDENTSTNPGDGLMGLTLKLVGSVSGVYGSVGTTLVDYALSDDGGRRINVNHHSKYKDNLNKEKYYWDLPLDGGYQSDEAGDSYFPDHTDNVAAASFKVENGLPAGRRALLKTQSRFEFAYIDYLGNGETCPCYGASTIYKTTKTKRVSNYVEYESVNP